MKGKTLAILCVSIVALAGVAVLTGCKSSPWAVNNWDRQHEQIKDEMEQLGDHPWAGSYYHGGGLAVNARLTLAPNGGCVFIWTGC